MKQTITVAVLALAVGGALGYYANTTSHSGSLSSAQAASNNASSNNNEPLYWVAPMDPNYQRDKPGKSPMGMDLIPVYADDVKTNTQEAAGTVTINPAVENNLGVKTTLVSRQSLAPHINTVGYVAFDDSQRWQINSRVSGWIQTLNVHTVGEKVQKGDVLFEIYSPELVRAQEELLNAKRIDKPILVQGAKDRLRALGVDDAQVNTLLRRGRTKQNIAIKAPAEGVITALNVRDGAYLSPQQTVISGGSLDKVWIDAEVLERQAHWIKTGTSAAMQIDALPGKSWQGKVDYVYPIIDAKTRTLRVRLEFNNANGELKPNMFANLTLTPRSDDNVLVIPEQAIIRSGNMERVVLALGDGKYRSTRINIGRSVSGMVEVTHGLAVNDKIVTSAQFMIDSESSQSADFSRIDQESHPANTVMVSGLVKNIMLDHQMLTIEHPAIAEWGWPAMTMDFSVADDSDLSQLIGGQPIRFLITKQDDGQYTVSDITLDHSSMGHGTVDHSQMDHGAMAHPVMDKTSKVGAL